ncbi:hypothetical protein [Nocardia concava]|uniref:hypothetical protein n=1 Tax=Nocardia concava TaxID=257281 RepID=UPI0012F9F6A1|nr:hypothetical protein [Nocardia concava]
MLVHAIAAPEFAAECDTDPSEALHSTELTNMIGSMTTRMTITVNDRLAALVREAAGSNISEWVSKAMTQRLLSEDAVALAAHAAADPTGTKAWYDDMEAEHEAATAADGSHRHPKGDAA